MKHIEKISDGTQGKDPRKMSVQELNDLGHFKKSMAKLIKENCNDCVGVDPKAQRSIEVSKCQCVRCHWWPYRMGKNPFSTRGEMSEERKAEVAERLREARRLRDA